MELPPIFDAAADMVHATAATPTASTATKAAAMHGRVATTTGAEATASVASGTPTPRARATRHANTGSVANAN